MRNWGWIPMLALALPGPALGCGGDDDVEDDAGGPDDGVDVADEVAVDAADADEDVGPGDVSGEAEDVGETVADGTGDVPGSPYCPVVDFEPCGGDLTGRWSLVAYCPEDPAAAAALYESPYDDHPECVGGGNETIGHSEVAGDFEFAADGSVTVSTTTTIVMEWVFTDGCLTAAGLAGATSAERCAAVGNDHLACEYAPDACRCISDPMEEAGGGGTTYTVTGNEVQLGEEPPAAYCVDGDSLIMDYYLYHPVSWRWWVFVRA